VLLALPLVLSSYLVTVFVLIFFYAYLGQAWNIVGGYAGQLSAGHAAFVGVGAYTAAVLSLSAGLTPWVGMFVGGALAAVLGAFIGFLGFRFGLRGFYFVLLTVAFAEMCRIVANNVEAIGGAVGLYITFTGNPRQFQFQDTRAYYYIALGLMIAATAVAAAIERRRFGVYLSAIREDEGAAEAVGVPTFRYKMLAMIVSSFLTGVGGTFYAFYLVFAPTQHGLRHPALGRDHHPSHRRRRRHALRARRGVLHPQSARRADAPVLRGGGRLGRRPPDRLRRSPRRRRALLSPGRGAVDEACARANAGLTACWMSAASTRASAGFTR